MSESDANKHLADTARLRVLCDLEPARDPLEDTQRMDVYDRRRRRTEATTLRERRKPATIGERNVQNAVETARDIFADRQQELIEAKLWPQY